MSPPEKEPWVEEKPEQEPWNQKVPLGARLAMGVLRGIGGMADLFAKRNPEKKHSTSISFGFGGPHVVRETYTQDRLFTFRILGAQAVEGKGTAVSGMAVQGEAHVGDTLTCVTTDGRRFSCELNEIQYFASNIPETYTVRAQQGVQRPPFCTLLVSGAGPEDFHPQDKFIIEK